MSVIHKPRGATVHPQGMLLRSALLLILVSNPAFPHSTPAELAELSMQELFDLEVGDGSDGPGSQTKWSFSYQFNFLEIEGYRNGTDDLSTRDVLWEPGEPRNARNFPVLPTEIQQEVHVFDVNYRATPRTSLRLSLPYIRQSTDHISIVPNYPEFLIKSNGMGDAKLSFTRDLGEILGGNLQMSAGISLPTGSIDEIGDTPRAPGDQQLPYTMQLGSGTVDVPLAINYHRSTSQGAWSFGVSAVVRTGKNDRSYRLGNSYATSARYTLATDWALEPFAAIDARCVEQIHGRDAELLVGNPTFPYPASITNPDMYGGTVASVKLGVKIPLGNTSSSLTLDVGYPLYQNLNGPQPKARWSSGIKLAYSL